MEIHRLREMVEHDPKLFNELYQKTKNLRRSLARQIDHRRYGETPDVVLSWFDDKFIYVFNKYYGEPENIVLGKIINALTLFKNRILRKAYTTNAEFHMSCVSIDDDEYTFNRIPDQTFDSRKEELLERIHQYMKENLSSDAFTIFQAEYDQPEYISSRIKPNKRVPTKLLAEFFDLADDKSIRYVNKLRKEVQYAIQRASEELVF